MILKSILRVNATLTKRGLWGDVGLCDLSGVLMFTDLFMFIDLFMFTYLLCRQKAVLVYRELDGQLRSWAFRCHQGSNYLSWTLVVVPSPAN